MDSRRRILGAGLLLLAAIEVAAAVLGPLGVGAIRYRTSPTTPYPGPPTPLSAGYTLLPCTGRYSGRFNEWFGYETSPGH